MELPELAMSQKGIKALCCRPFILTEVDSYGHALTRRTAENRADRELLELLLLLQQCMKEATPSSPVAPSSPSSPSCRVTGRSGRMLMMFSLVTMPPYILKSSVLPCLTKHCQSFIYLSFFFRRVLRSQRLHSGQFAQNLLENEHSKFQ